jgi:tetratricopeptide (TPR) repeat protein
MKMRKAPVTRPALILGLALVLACAGGYNERADTYYEEGLLFFKQMEYGQSIQSFTRVLQLAPDGEQNHLVYYNRGMAYFRNREYENAIYDFTKALELAPSSDRRFARTATEWRGNAYQKDGQPRAAIEDYTRALALDAENENTAYILNNRAWCYVDQGELEPAIADFSRAVEIDDAYAAAYYGRAAVWLKKQDYQRAMIDAKEALRLDPPNRRYDDLLHEIKTAAQAQ